MQNLKGHRIAQLHIRINGSKVGKVTTFVDEKKTTAMAQRRALGMVPNSLTLLNMLCGSLSTVVALAAAFNPAYVAYLHWAPWLVMAAAVFDVFDGLVARSLGVSSRLGVELDSLSDLISFGLAPATMLMALGALTLGGKSWPMLSLGEQVLLLLPLVYTLAAGYRLAKFNIDTRQTHTFRGLPTPAAALFVCGLTFIPSSCPAAQPLLPTISCSYGLNTWAVLLAIALLLPMPLLSLKMKLHSMREALPMLLVIVGGIAGIAFFGPAGLLVITPLYIVISLFARRLILRSESEDK